MKAVCLIPLAATLFVASAYAQDRIYRCGNEYTNNVQDAEARGCKLIDGANVTVIQSQRPAAQVPAPMRIAAAVPNGPRVDPGEQRARDNESRAILEAELRKMETRQAELLKEFNNGEPEKRGDESRNYQKYLDRVAELKASIARNDSDIAGVKRELARLPAATTKTN